MILFIRFAVIYFLCATAWNFYLREDLFFVGAKLVASGGRAFHVFSYFAIGMVFFALWSWLKSDSHLDFAKRVVRSLIMLAFCCLFLSSFSSVKSSLPYAAQMLGFEHFFADPFFAELDRTLHFGIDPWVFTHNFTEMLGWDEFAMHASIVYGPLWIVLAFYLPAIMMFAGEDQRTINHYVILYAFSWVVLGNVLALVGQSGGPIYYDRITETARFADLHASLAASQSMAESWFAIVQPNLWAAYSNEQQSMGSGIAAFPSLHLGMITVAALYLAEKHMILRLYGILMVITIMFTSVWVGYHYAIDGYFSIIVIYGAHLALKRWTAPRSGNEGALGVPATPIQNA